MSFGQDGVALRRQLRDSVPLHLGIIGCGGYPGERHAEGWLETGAVKLVAACDLSAPKLAAFSATYGAERSYENYHDLLADPDVEVVIVSLPTFLHEPVSIDALNAGNRTRAFTTGGGECRTADCSRSSRGNPRN
jgi:hypothetical protein